MTWDPRVLPRQDGRTVVVTGGNAGIGYFTSEQLAAAGARVILASRSRDKTERAMAALRDRVPDAQVAFVELDIASFASIRRAAEELRAQGPIAALINNAGQVIPPGSRQETADGLELLVGGNAIGHFLLTALLLPALEPTGRVVGLGSLSTRLVTLEPEDLLSVRRYRGFRAYAFSKHAVHGFAFELDRRLRAAGDARASLLAHPGYAVTELAEQVPGVNDKQSTPHRLVGRLSAPFAQGKDRGAWPSVRAALDPAAQSGEFYGPGGFSELKGSPRVVAPVASSASLEFGARLWALAEESTGQSVEL